MQQIKQEEPIDWELIKAEHDAMQEMYEKIKDDKKNPLNSIWFGLGQPIKVYQENVNFQQCRFEGYSTTFLWYIRLIPLIILLLLSIPFQYTCAGAYWTYWYYWSLWSWYISMFANILTLLAQCNPDYWSTTATVWLEFAQQTNIGVVIGFWGILFPMIFPALWNYSNPENNMDHGHYAKMMKTHKAAKPNLGMNDFLVWDIAVNVYCHVLPIIMNHLNIYYSDIKLQEGDWTIQVWTLFLYMFANFLGSYEMNHYVYPIITWESYPYTIGVFCLAIAITVGAHYGYTVAINKCLKRRDSQ